MQPILKGTFAFDVSKPDPAEPKRTIEGRKCVACGLEFWPPVNPHSASANQAASDHFRDAHSDLMSVEDGGRYTPRTA